MKNRSGSTENNPRETPRGRRACQRSRMRKMKRDWVELLVGSQHRWQRGVKRERAAIAAQVKTWELQLLLSVADDLKVCLHAWMQTTPSNQRSHTYEWNTPLKTQQSNRKTIWAAQLRGLFSECPKKLMCCPLIFHGARGRKSPLCYRKVHRVGRVVYLPWNLNCGGH